MSIFCDHLLKSDKMSRTNVRKMAITISCLGQGVATLGLAFSGCNTTVAIICLVLTTSVGGVDTSGQIASMVDLSPNFASRY
ncbi:unnamed protein product, partial [Timema podura]|nr:unnamed protein product [Timema podura]